MSNEKKSRIESLIPMLKIFFHVMQVSAGSILFEEETWMDRMWIVEDGCVELDVSIKNGTHDKMRIEKGGLILPEALFSPHFSGVSGLCIEESHIIEITKQSLHEFCESEPKLAYELLSQIAENMSRQLIALKLASKKIDGILTEPKALELGQKLDVKRMQA